MIAVLGGISHIYEPVMRAVPNATLVRCDCTDRVQCSTKDFVYAGPGPTLIIAAGWRHLIQKSTLRTCTVVGFHHAKLPEYPGRAPVPWTILRGDAVAYTNLLYLTEEPDAGDIIDTIRVPAVPDAKQLYIALGELSAVLLERHLPGILDGTAPRHPQDMSKRGPLTTADGWQRLGQSL